MSFDVIDHEQGTAKWLRWRHDGIGASEAAALMGENPWKSEKRLFAEKCAPPRSFGGGGGASGGGGNSAMARGTALEPYARGHYQDATGHDLQPLCLQSSARPWQRASLDGINIASQRLVEIKCGDRVYEHTETTGTVPRYYIGQLQHIMAVTGYASIDFWAWLPKRRGLLLTIARDDAYITRMTLREAAFWQRVEAARGVSAS
jgi:putative phage-type endonuclease